MDSIEIPRLGAHVEIGKEECAELIDDLYTLAGIWEQLRYVYRTVASHVQHENLSQLENIQGQIQDHITHKILLSSDRAYKNRVLSGTAIDYQPLKTQG
jgi:hypothetical protein